MNPEFQFRWVTAYLLLVQLGVSIYWRWLARRSGDVVPRSAEPKRIMAARLLMAILVLMPLGWYLLAPTSLPWSKLWLLDEVRWVGAALCAASILLVFWTLKTLGPNVTETTLTKQSHVLVTAGPYRLIRHPFYAFTILFLLGVSILTASWLILLGMAVCTVIHLRVIIPAEEDSLAAKFGQPYRDYVSRTGRLLPKNRGDQLTVYRVPSRFGVAAVLTLTTSLAVFFGALKYMNAPAAAYLFVGSQIAAICLVQIFFKSVPRGGSALAGAVLLPLWVYLTVIMPGRLNLLTAMDWPQMLLALSGFAAFGGLVGYCTGALAAGFFLVMDIVEQYADRARDEAAEFRQAK